MTAAFLTEEQRDGLQEIINISMGQAANNLATLIGKHIQLSIPCIEQVAAEQFQHYLVAHEGYAITRQSFLGELNGEILALIHAQGSRDIAVLMNFPAQLSAAEDDELKLELTNMLAGACIQGLISQLGLKLHLAAPTLLSTDLCHYQQWSWQQALLLRVSFAITATAFNSTILICLQQASVPHLHTLLDLLLE